jgi:hypothetical protein
MAYLQDPDEVLSYSIDWTKALADGEEISTSTWTVETGSVEIGSGSYAPTAGETSTTVWILGGVLGENSKVTNRVVTDSTPPSTMEESIHIMTRRK